MELLTLLNKRLFLILFAFWAFSIPIFAEDPSTAADETTNGQASSLPEATSNVPSNGPSKHPAGLASNNLGESGGSGVIQESCEDGRRQSPIAFNPGTMFPPMNRDPSKNEVLRINKFYGVKRDRFYVKNTGKAVIVMMEENPTCENTIRGKGWTSQYVLAHIVLHWSSTGLGDFDDEDEANAQNGTFPLEMQFVHYSGACNTLKEASGNDIFIATVLFELSGVENDHLEPIVRAALTVASPNESPNQVHGPLDLKNLFPADISLFQYNAKDLPSDNCNEGVKWAVFKHPLSVSFNQMRPFMNIRDTDGKRIERNFYPVLLSGGKKSEEYILTISPDAALSRGSSLTMRSASLWKINHRERDQWKYPKRARVFLSYLILSMLVQLQSL